MLSRCVQEDAKSAGAQKGGTEQKLPESGVDEQPALPAAPKLPIAIPAAATAVIAEEDDYDDYD